MIEFFKRSGSDHGPAFGANDQTGTSFDKLREELYNKIEVIMWGKSSEIF